MFGRALSLSVKELRVILITGMRQVYMENLAYPDRLEGIAASCKTSIDSFAAHLYVKPRDNWKV